MKLNNFIRMQLKKLLNNFWINDIYIYEFNNVQLKQFSNNF